MKERLDATDIAKGVIGIDEGSERGTEARDLTLTLHPNPNLNVNPNPNPNPNLRRETTLFWNYGREIEQ